MIGRILVTTDKNVMINSLSSYKVITIVDVDNITNDLKAISTIASFLLPPYEVMSKKICDENENLFIQYYTQYLSQGEPIEFIAILYKALLQGVNVLLYLPSDYEMFINELISILTANFGFMINAPEGLNINYKNTINSLMYLYNLIGPYDLLNDCDNNIPQFSINSLPQEVILKLSVDIFLPYNNMNYEDIMSYLNRIVEHRSPITGKVMRPIWRNNNVNLH